ncbi:MAG: hypothetical protein KIT09_35950, partial [Bryobacteraceae bacterium]|nr:hypothetical protein [Bryobacteraceae bacterium]
PETQRRGARPGRLRLATWNLGNLHAIDGESTFGGSDPSVKRFAIDYENIRCSSRPTPGGMNGKQNTGFAYKKSLTVEERPDVETLDVSNGGLRHGTRIDVTQGDQTFSLMSVHLKSGCFDNNSSGSACNTLNEPDSEAGRVDR